MPATQESQARTRAFARVFAAPELYERAAMAMDAAPLVRLIFGVLVAIGLYLA